jgi:energy-coupling factor transporter ATP-binding protein EcfA2
MLARKFVQQALQNWFELGLLKANWALSEQQRFTGRIGRLAADIQTSSERLTSLLTPLFSELSQGNYGADDTFEVLEVDGHVHVLHNKINVLRCDVDELVPSFKAYLTEQILARSSPDVALHAACLIAGGKSLLVSGRPGAGKTTLALHLLDLGFEYGGDDIVLITPDGRAEGVPFPPGLKRGAWAMIAKLRGNLGDSIVHRRPDGKRVRYLNVSRRAGSGSHPVGWIIFLKRIPDAAATLTPLGQLETMSRLMDGSYATGGKLTQKAFAAIKRTLTEARSFELTYSSAFDAGDAIADICNG